MHRLFLQSGNKKREKMKITKSTVECYKIRDLKEGWADITIDAKDEYGRISIASDFGNWQYFWSHCGMPFKRFLTTVDKDYVARKFGAKGFLDVDSTIKNYKETLIESRRFGMDKKKARKIYDEIKFLEKHWTGQTEFEIVISTLPNLMSYWDGMPEASKTYHPLFSRFWDEIWIEFVAHLKTESTELAAV